MRNFVPIMALAALLQQAGATDLYVSPAGNDRGPGSLWQPFRTLERAREEVRSIRKHKAPGDTITVWLGGGVYSRTNTFELKGEDSGTAKGPTVYAARPGEEVRITGGIEATGFQPANDPEAFRRLLPHVRQHVMETDLKAAGVRDFGTHRQFGHGLPVVPAPMELFWNDTVMQLAHYPDRGGIPIGEIVDMGSVPRVGDYGGRGGTFRYTDPRHTRWTGARDVWFQGFFHHGFADDKILVAGIDTVKGEVRLAAPHMYGLGSGENFNEYVALNLLEELDQPGEWYVSPSSGKLFFWPPGDIRTARVTLSIVEQPLIALDGTSYVTLRELTVECGRGIGISIEGGTSCRISRCVVRNFGTLGIMMGQGARQTFPHVTADDYTGVPVSREVGTYHAHLYRNSVWERNAGTHHTIESCQIYQTGSGGILLGGGSKKDLIPGGSVVTDCRIHDFTRRNKAGAAGVIVDGCGQQVVHNEIFGGDLQAVLVYGNDHLFEYNLIHHVAVNSNDASAWYLGRDPSNQGNVVRRNFFHHVGRPDRKWTMGVYCDDATCGVLVEENVFYKVASYGTVYSNGGHDIVVRNNLFIDGYGPAYQLKSMWYDFGLREIPYFFGQQGIYTQRLTRSVDIKKPPYSTRYPLLTDWMDLLPDGKTYVGMRPRRNVFDRNVLVSPEETFRLVGQYAQTDYGRNFVTFKDPGFINAEAMDFRLKKDSPVFTELPDFQPIPMEQIGPRADR
jgi:hypothetical protein